MDEKNRQRKQQVLEFMSYRLPMKVAELLVYRNNDSYYICPRCRSALERDFCNYCEHCGQALDWSQHKKARRIPRLQ